MPEDVLHPSTSKTSEAHWGIQVINKATEKLGVIHFHRHTGTEVLKHVAVQRGNWSTCCHLQAAGGQIMVPIWFFFFFLWKCILHNGNLFFFSEIWVILYSGQERKSQVVWWNNYSRYKMIHNKTHSHAKLLSQSGWNYCFVIWIPLLVNSKYSVVKVPYISKFRQQIISQEDICCNSYHQINVALSLPMNLMYTFDFFYSCNFSQIKLIFFLIFVNSKFCKKPN